MAESGLVAVGRLLRVRGNRGELIGEIYSSQPGRAEKLRKVVLEIDGRESRASEIERIWWHDSRPVFKFVGIDSISDAEAWAGADLMVAASERAVPEAGEYSHADLIGCRLLDMANGNAPVGTVDGLEEYGASPLLVVKSDDGREILVPFARSICKEIDVAAKVIRAEIPDGLLES